MNTTKMPILDVMSAFLAGAVLYHLEAPWWAYLLMLLCGACQQLVGREKGKREMVKRGLRCYLAIATKSLPDPKS